MRKVPITTPIPIVQSLTPGNVTGIELVYSIEICVDAMKLGCLLGSWLKVTEGVGKRVNLVIDMGTGTDMLENGRRDGE